ncbi:MAG: endonuclease MutS2 [Clostridia bacterium]|nr:endonuclease MutS2 [Clostridia bacterium]
MDLYCKLEYNQIIQIIEKYCKTYLGKKLCFQMEPTFSFEKVRISLLETMEAVKLLYAKGHPPLAALNQLEIPLKTLESNQILSAKSLLDLAHLLKVSRELKDYFKKDFLSSSSQEVSEENINILQDYFSMLYANPSIEQEIFNKILDENTISDNASSKLFSLRKSHRNLEQGIKDKLSSLLHSSSYTKYLMEPVITIRNNRYVIPVKQEYRANIQGFIHDISSSGSTVYIEPTSIFEANNQIASLRMEEDIEIEKILQSLTNNLYTIFSELMLNISTIGTLDLLFAKAEYAKENNAVMPILNREKKINLIKAKHPLIASNIVVPVDISLGETYTSLVITGPNTGGKTVALKTVGLLLLMAYSGIPLPCHEESQICVFDHIFVDIGDEQNIQESLSTFSSHMLHIVEITKQITSNSLVLLDELGSGTDPIEGASLAISILEYLAQKGALTLCTTHYQELKEFALVTDDFENASFEFDVENLKPTYHLLVGIPGKSNAFEISKRLGLSSDIIERASSFIKQDHASIEEILKSIYEDKIMIEKQKEEIQKNLNQIEVLRKSLEHDNSDLLQKRQQMLEDAKSEARDVLFSAKEEANEILQELTKNEVDIRKANQLRNELNDKIKDLGSVSTNVINSNPLTKSEVSQGLEVWVPSLQNSGVILSSHVNKNDEVQVQVGLVKMNLKLDELSSSSTNNNMSRKNTNLKFDTLKHGKVTTAQDSKAKFISPEINVIGQNIEDAIYVIDKYLDNCIMSGISPIRIVHGKGTGKLREGIHQYLKKHSHVKSFRIGTFGEGEMGVTVVELK